MKDERTDRSGADRTSTPAGRLTPADVQQKQFRTARMGGGYRMREVDEFLDQITDTLSSLIAENERLRRRQPSPSSAPAGPIVPSGASDRAAIEAFLRSEKGFLQSLGTLVQGHAEDLKDMVRAARAGGPAPEAPSEAAPAPVVPSEPAHAEAPQPAAAEPTPAEPPPTATAVEPAVEPAQVARTPASSEIQDEGVEVPDEEPAQISEPAEQETGSMPTVETEEPIRLDEPEPARRSRRNEETTGSLRELFWGEE
jgi:DivIVA domain-containing protein